MRPIFFNHCVGASTFPSSSKSSLFVNPIPKLAAVDEMKDLRPISTLPALWKVFERCVNAQLPQFVGYTNTLLAYQSDIPPELSCTVALLHVVDDILQATDNGEIAVLILLDFSRAFDTVHYDVLLRTLDSIGWNPKAVALIQLYLRGGMQQDVLYHCIFTGTHLKSIFVFHLY
ncbi:hypothetical protein Trydic_g12470 [Trypoxylus dichotomus]